MCFYGRRRSSKLPTPLLPRPPHLNNVNFRARWVQLRPNTAGGGGIGRLRDVREADQNLLSGVESNEITRLLKKISLAVPRSFDLHCCVMEISLSVVAVLPVQGVKCVDSDHQDAFTLIR